MSRSSAPCDHLEPTLLLLSRLMRRASAPLLAGTLVAGCSDEPVSYSGRPHCVNNAWVPTSNITLTHDVAYASLRSTDGRAVVIQSASGKPCDGAADEILCASEIERVSRAVTEPGRSFLLTTDRDLVEAFQTLSEKLSLLGTIDTPDEALLIAQHEGYPIECATEIDRIGKAWGIVALQRDPCSREVAQRIHLSVGLDGALEKTGDEQLEVDSCAIGRRPPGLCHERRAVDARSALARYFARAARLEAGAVDAFAILERELTAKGLPRALCEKLREAADDEVRHARDSARLAERYGARAQRAKLGKVAARSLADIALDNAIEGCVTETYGALVAHVQASYARDPELRRVLTSIAREETRHAALSWQLAAWMEPQLDDATRNVISTRRGHAIASLGARSRAPV